MPLTDSDRIHIRGTVTLCPHLKRVIGAFMVMTRDDRMRQLEDELAKAAGVKPGGNHVVYAIGNSWRPRVVFDHIEVRGTGTLYAWFHDNEVFFGNTIVD